MLWRGELLEAALPRAFRNIVLANDRGLARAIAGAVLRHLTDLDALIDSATRSPLPDDARARMVLRMALAQAFVLQTPPHAVIATALPLLEGGPRRLAHGVLSTLFKADPSLPSPPTLPQLWRDRWGAAVAAAASAALAGEPPLDLTLAHAGETESWCERLGGRSLMPGHVRLDGHRGRIEELAGYGEGAWWIQDLGASLPARLLAPASDEVVFDLCAAPGGKTLQLAAAGARVTAVELSPKRAERITENLERTRLAAEVVVADALGWNPGASAAAILLDAPCSATGTFRRHPDVLYSKSAANIAALVKTQAALLDRAVDLLPEGGRLVYCVCSMEREEGDAQIAGLLSRRADVATAPIAAAELPPGLAADANGWLRTGPGDLVAEGGIDGFFIARLVKTRS